MYWIDGVEIHPMPDQDKLAEYMGFINNRRQGELPNTNANEFVSILKSKIMAWETRLNKLLKERKDDD